MEPPAPFIQRLAHWLLRTALRAAWAPVAVLAVHLAAIRFFDLYSRFPDFDIPMHFLGGMAIAYFFDRTTVAASQAGLTVATDRFTQGMLVFALTVTAAVFWEFTEFLQDHFLGTHTQEGLADTLGDLLMGTLGGSTFLIAGWWRKPRPKP